jgi:hypothetical protein
MYSMEVHMMKRHLLLAVIGLATIGSWYAAWSADDAALIKDLAAQKLASSKG